MRFFEAWFTWAVVFIFISMLVVGMYEAPH